MQDRASDLTHEQAKKDPKGKHVLEMPPTREGLRAKLISLGISGLYSRGYICPANPITTPGGKLLIFLFALPLGESPFRCHYSWFTSHLS